MSSTQQPVIDLAQLYDSAFTYAIYTVDLCGNVTTWSKGAERTFGFSAAEMLEKDSAIVFTPEDRATGQHKKEISAAMSHGCASDYRWHMRKNGTRFWADGTMTPLFNDDGAIVGCVKICKDITNRKLAQDEIRRLATVDPLTGLASRSFFDQRFPEEVRDAIDNGKMLLVLLVDLDRFKQVNDSYGHHSGDLLLQQAADRMRSVAGEHDFLARLGGDEFVVLQRQETSGSARTDLASKLVDVLSQSFDIQGARVEIGASVGIAACPADAKEPSDLLKKADLALYRVKANGRNGFQQYTCELDHLTHRRHRDLAALRLAVSSEGLYLEYQPIIEYRTGQVKAVEALLRFTGPAISSHSIDYLLDLAKEAGLVVQIGNWVISRACAQLREWKAAGVGNFKMHINMCAEDLLDSRVLETIDSALSEFELRPEDLEIELTEREAIDIEAHGITTLHQLHAKGIALALDDFGTGYSALGYLQTLPVSTLKLDKSFLRGIPHDRHSCAIANLVLGLARSLGLNLIIEGVESVEQAEFLSRSGSTLFQGFLISRPVDSHQLSDWLIENNKANNLP